MMNYSRTSMKSFERCLLLEKLPKIDAKSLRNYLTSAFGSADADNTAAASVNLRTNGDSIYLYKFEKSCVV